MDCDSFVLNPETGHIEASSAFPPPESKNRYTLTVIAEDGAPSASNPGAPNSGKW